MNYQKYWNRQIRNVILFVAFFIGVVVVEIGALIYLKQHHHIADGITVMIIGGAVAVNAALLASWEN